MTQIIKNNFKYAELTGKVIGVAMEIHRHLGSGFLESVYEEAFAYELSLNNIDFERQKPINIFYKDKIIKNFICDIIVEDKVIVELKAIKTLTEIEIAQTINYLKATKHEIGLLFNFGSKSLEFKRLIETNLRNQRNPRLS